LSSFVAKVEPTDNQAVGSNLDDKKDNTEAASTEAATVTNPEDEGVQEEQEDDDAIKKLAEEFSGEMSKYDNNPESNFMSLLIYTLQLRNSPYSDSRTITKLRNSLPDSIKTISAPNFCLKHHSSPRYIFAFDNPHFEGQLDDQRIGMLDNSTKPLTGAEWTIEASENGDYVYLKNVHRDQYMYATEDMFPDSDRYQKIAFGPKEGSGAFGWVFLFQENNPKQFVVQNLEQKRVIEYYCDDGRDPIKTVCTAIQNFEELEYNTWVFESC
jgi:hypothetical protein